MLSETLAVILAGGAGSRLQPLTRDRAKPAVPFGGKYRIIDFTLANCLHSGLRRVLVLTQYKSFSLQKHLRDGWSIFNPELGEYITTVPPQMQTQDNVYVGTADAVFQNLYLLKRSGAKWVVILSGDHIYRMDYAAMLRSHKEFGAGLTVATMQVPREEGNAFGIMEIDANNKVLGFEEKPAKPRCIPGDEKHCMASMGVYVFSTGLLLDVLQQDSVLAGSSHDFGKDLIPRLVAAGEAYAYGFGGSSGRVTPDRYWRDVGAVDSYYEANMELLLPVPPLNLYQKDWRIRTYEPQYPPLRTVPGRAGAEGLFINSIAAGGTIIAGGAVEHSILFPEVFVDDHATLHNAILFNGVKVGRGARLQNCIVDKGVEIPEGLSIGYDRVEDAKRFTLSEKGVVVVPRGYTF